MSQRHGSLMGSKNYGNVHKGEITALATSSDYLFTADRNGHIKQFSLPFQTLIHDYGKCHSGEIWSMALSKRHLFSSDQQGKLLQFSLDLKTITKDYGKIHTGEIWSIALTKNDRWLFTSDFDGNLKQFDVA